MKKPWIYLDGGRRLEAFLGARGMKTGDIATTEELIQTAAGVFEIPMETTCLKMADAIASMSKSQRRKLARKNIGPMQSRRDSKARSRALKAQAPLKALAAELRVDPDELGEALRAFVNRKKAIADCQTKTMPQRVAEAEQNWKGRIR